MLLRRIWRRGESFSIIKGSSLLQRKHSVGNGHITAPTPTAGIIVIGDEILKGQVRDTNSLFIMSRLYKLGVRVMKVSVIGDDANEISNEVREFSQLFSYVITSGGIGPTHDDVTFEGIAKAFEESLIPHPELVKMYAKFYKTTEKNAAVLKLACVPESAKLVYRYNTNHERTSLFPNISVKNVYIFPGVPCFLEKSFAVMCEDVFGGSGTKFYQSDLFLRCDEVSIAEQLSVVASDFPDVNFGSYPVFNQSHYSVKLTVEADNMDLIAKAVCKLQEVLPEGCIVHHDPAPLSAAYDKVVALSLQKDMQHVERALQNVLKVLLDCREHSSRALCLDASVHGMVVLHIIHAAAEKLQMMKDDFPTVLLDGDMSTISVDHLQDCATKYSLNVKAGPCDINSAISQLKSSCPGLTLLIVGVQSNINALKEPLDLYFGPNKVSIMAPVSDWNDCQVLAFIRSLSLTSYQNI